MDKTSLLAALLFCTIPTVATAEDTNGSAFDVFDCPIPEGTSQEPEWNDVLLDAITAKDIAAVKKQLAGMSQEDMEANIYIEAATATDWALATAAMHGQCDFLLHQLDKKGAESYNKAIQPLRAAEKAARKGTKSSK